MELSRFTEFTEPDPATGCINWTGTLTVAGYGFFWADEIRTHLAHRLAWFLAYGDFPKQTIDHTCRNRRCVNVEHLRDVPQSRQFENYVSYWGSKTECPQHHPYDEANTRYGTRGNGSKFRICLTCERERTHAKRGPEKEVHRGPRRRPQ